MAAGKGFADLTYIFVKMEEHPAMIIEWKRISPRMVPSAGYGTGKYVRKLRSSREHRRCCFMKKKKMIRNSAAVLLAAAVALPALEVPVPAAAASYPKKLKVNHTYTSCDITGDQKPDRIQIKAKNVGQYGSKEYQKAVFYINRKKAYTLKSEDHAYSLTAEIYLLSGGKKLLYVYFPGDNGDGPCRILLYQNGKLKSILNMEKLLGISKFSFHNNGEVTQVKGKQVTIEMYGVNNTLGITQYFLKYKFRDGKLVRVGKTAKLKVHYPTSEETLTAAKTIPVYSRPGESGNSSAAIRKGTHVHAEKFWLKKNQQWIYVTTAGGVKGWIKSGKVLFSDAFYAG